MPSRKRVAKNWELASRSLKDTAPASLARFSDMVRLTPETASPAVTLESSGRSEQIADIVAGASAQGVPKQKRAAVAGGSR
jgi:hypothetical protein